MYDMLAFAVAYRGALDTITGDREMKLRKYEMDDEEWEIARQLCEVLKVSFDLLHDSFIHLRLDFQRRHTLLLS